MKINIKFMPTCASCKHWDDPARSALKPTIGKNVWEVDNSQVRLCMNRRLKMKASATCGKHEYKSGMLQ